MTTPPGDMPLAPLRSEFANDPDMAELVEAFVTELPQRVQAVAAAFTSGNVDDMKRLSHQIKGAAGGYGYPTVGDAAAKIEMSLKTSADPSAALKSMTREVQALVDLCCRATAPFPHVKVARPKF